MYQPNRPGRLICILAAGKVDLHFCDLPVFLSNGMVVEKVVACVRCVTPSSPIHELLFTAFLENPAIQGSPETGESLDCQTWEDHNWAVSIGTEDQEMLNTRLPALCIAEDPYPVQYSPSRIDIILRKIKMLKPATFRFIMAFKRLPDDRECSTWFAVDVPRNMANKVVNRTP